MPPINWTFNTLAQLSIIGMAFGSQIVTTHHFECQDTQEGFLTDDALAQTAAAALATTWITECKSKYLECLSTNYAMQLVRSQVLERPGNWRHRLTPTDDTEAGAGSSAGTSEGGGEAITAGVIRWRTARAGKSFRGRSYLAPLPSAWQVSGLLSAAGLGALTAYRDEMLATFVNATVPVPPWRLTIYSKPYLNGEYGYPTGSHPTKTFHYPEDYGGNSTWVTTGAVDPVLRTQRRRQQGVGV